MRYLRSERVVEGDLKGEVGFGGDKVTEAALGVAEGSRDQQEALAAFAHGGHALVHAGDGAALAKGKCKGFVALNRAIEAL